MKKLTMGAMMMMGVGMAMGAGYFLGLPKDKKQNLTNTAKEMMNFSNQDK